MTLLAKIARRPPADLLLAVEALVLLTFFRVCLAVVPVRRIIRAITHSDAELNPGGVAESKDAEAISERDLQIARRVQWSVVAVARHSLLKFVCFPQTLAAFTMLHSRGVHSTIVYGVARSAEGELIGHTWLEVGDGYITGGEESVGFTPVERWT